uniref:Uncharacterized protein n=1 Tax=Anguilla anguilla TaxID=7936 RepID=A0A0E9QBY6_ANGAN
MCRTRNPLTFACRAWGICILVLPSSCAVLTISLTAVTPTQIIGPKVLLHEIQSLPREAITADTFQVSNLSTLIVLRGEVLSAHVFWSNAIVDLQRTQCFPSG